MRKLLILIIGLLLPASLFAAGIAFDPVRRDFPVGSWTYSVVGIADLNGDGNADLAVPNTGANTLSVLTGDGTGMFAPWLTLPTGLSPRSVVVADFNGDTQPDLAVANTGSHSIRVFVSVPGGFTPVGDFPTLSSPRYVAAGDINDDGKADLVVAHLSSVNQVSVLLGNGNGSFQPPINYGTQTVSYSVAIGDLNGDTFLDLAIPNYNASTVSILLNNGSGSLLPAVHYPVGPFPITVAIGDLNADGRPDLATANGSVSASVSILIGYGNGSFFPATNIGTGSEANSVAISDLNADGKLDLAVNRYNANDVLILRGNGNGTFQPPITYGPGLGYYSVAIGDLNKDSKPDLALGNDNVALVSTHLNTVSLPIWNVPYPQVSAVSPTSIQVATSADRDGASYLICLPSGDPAPTSTQVRSGQDAAGTALAANLTDSISTVANNTSSLACSALASGTAYDLYVVTDDAEGSLQIVPTLLSATTDVTVTPSASIGGSLSPSTPQVIDYNTTTSFTVTPDTGYHLVDVTGCGGTLNSNTYTTSAVTADCTVTATFALDAFTVTPSAGAGGSINPNTPQTVNYNSTTSFTVTPDTGYSIASVTGCGGSLVGNTYTTSAVTADCTVTATFALDAFTVTPSAGAGGSISPNTPQTVNYGDSTSFTVTPSLGYYIGTVSGCGGTTYTGTTASTGAITYNTGGITANCQVNASFSRLVVSAPTALTVIPPSAPSVYPMYLSMTKYATVNWGASQTPSATYELQVSFNGGSYRTIYQGTKLGWKGVVTRGVYVFRVRANMTNYQSSDWLTSSPLVVR